jgi:hypothetical protein
MRFVSSKGGQNVRRSVEGRLWTNQQEAFEKAEVYLQNPEQQCLIRMPTGSGKTAVIAVLSQLSADHKKVLLIAPWEHLVDQLRDQVAEGFWVKAGLFPILNLRPVVQFTPATFDKELAAIGDEGVLVCTNSSLELLQSGHLPRYKKLAQWVDLILVDEGHREPAPQWAHSIRALGKPTILFSATPYRNDSRLFSFLPKHTYAYTFPRAVDDKVIRDVEFTEGAWSRGRSETARFVTALINFRDDRAHYMAVAANTLKVIVHCKTADRVELVVRALQKATDPSRAIGVHEQFSGIAGAYRNRVPLPGDPEGEVAEFWVHQWKLIEGLDDSRFRIVALFDGFPNSRNLVQQVGRIVRNPLPHLADQKCFVLSHLQDKQRTLWDGYEAYEKDAQKSIDEGKPVLSIVDSLREKRASLQTFYLRGYFRKHLHVDQVIDPREFVRMRLSTAALRLLTPLSFDKIIEEIEDDLVERDAVTYGSLWRENNRYLQLYEVIEPSEEASELYLETRIAYVFAWLSGDRLYIADSEGAVPENLRKKCEVLSHDELARVLPDGSARIGEITVLNGDLGNHTVRRKILVTDSLAAVPPSLSDYHHVCTTAAGRVDVDEEVYRRYVGFTRGRISQRVGKPVEYPLFQEWLDDLNKVLSDPAIEGDDSLCRFAEPAKYDEVSKIEHVLFDLEQEDIDHTALISVPAPLDPSVLWRVESDGRMVGVIDGKFFNAEIKWSKERRRFLVKSDALAEVKIVEPEQGKTVSLVNFLNSSQAFRGLIGGPRDLIYTQGRFFRPNSAPWLGGRRRFDLINIVTASVSLDLATSEKGGAADIVWPAHSVFGAIFPVTRPDGVFRSAGYVPDVLICYDIATVPEIADFFAYTENPKRLIQIQCKVAGDNSRMAASAFHELCGQTVRYLAFFNPIDTLTKITADKVGGDWRIMARSRPRLLVNTGNLTPGDITKRIDQLARDPSCAREVWMVMGQGLSKGDLAAAVVPKADPPIGVRHMVYLLQATWSTVASVGASLKVFCRT